MSLFEWSTPERQGSDKILPVIPNEIYFYIFDHVAPPGRLKPEGLRTFARLSRVCRFFANFCLPRIFAFASFSGHVLHNMSVELGASPGTTLCTQLVAKQSLALSLANAVNVSHFADWRLATDSTMIQLMSHMKNIRELNFFNCVIGTMHWDTIAALGSLGDLSFVQCEFLQEPAGIKVEKSAKIRVSRLCMSNCTGNCQHITTLDSRYLHILDVDCKSFDQVDWLPHSALTELRLSFQRPLPIPDLYMDAVAFMGVVPSFEMLEFVVGVQFGLTHDVVRRTLDGPPWSNLSLLSSFTLQVHSLSSEDPSDVISSALEGIGPLTSLQSFTLKDFARTPKISPTKVQRILQDKFSPVSRLRYANIYGKVIHLVHGEWLEAPSSTT